MTTLVEEWAKFAHGLFFQPEIIVSGVQRIHRNVVWEVPANIFLDGSMTLKNSGYTPSKITQLKRFYYDQASIDRSKLELERRIRGHKYGSGFISHRGIPKKGFTKQDFCMVSTIISYYPQRRCTYVDSTWRTTEVIKRFRGDLIFLRDVVLPTHAQFFKEAPIKSLRFSFANVTAHPMYYILLVPYVDWKSALNHFIKHNPRLAHHILHWCWRYLVDPSRSIEAYSSAHQVVKIARKLTDPDELQRFARYVDRHYKHNGKKGRVVA